MKKLLLLALLAITSLALFAVIDLETPPTNYSGKVIIKNARPWLDVAESDLELRLLLAPQAELDTLNLHLEQDDEISIEGIHQDDLILVSKIQKGDALWIIRDFKLGAVYPEGAAYRVDPKKCIACKLCINPCPTGAISRLKGKAVIDLSKCTECGICIEGHSPFRGCPVKAISPK